MINEQTEMKKTAAPSQVERKVWSKPQVQVVKMNQAELDLSLQNFDGILYQAS